MLNKDVTIVVADDHPMLLKGFVDELEANNYNVVGRAIDGKEAIQQIVDHRPTIAFLDIDMPHFTGFEVIRMAKQKGIQSKFVVFSFHKETDYIVQAKTLQIDGYILKEDPFAEVQRCIHLVLEGNQYFSPSFDADHLRNANEELVNIEQLTASEKMILRLIAERTSTQEISEMLGVSSRTIEKHRSNIISKLELNRGTNALTNWALVNKKLILNL